MLGGNTAKNLSYLNDQDGIIMIKIHWLYSHHYDFIVIIFMKRRESCSVDAKLHSSPKSHFPLHCDLAAMFLLY